jgi:hypothetical protein
MISFNKLENQASKHPLHDQTAALDAAEDILLLLLLLRWPLWPLVVLLRGPLLMPTTALTIMLLLLMVRLLMMLLLVMATTTSTAIPAVVTPGLGGQRRRRLHPPTLQININAPFIILGGIVQPSLPTHPLHPRLQLLDVPRRVVSLADNDMQVRLPGGLGVADALLEDVLGLLDKLAVQVDGVLGDAAGAVVLPEDELRGLLVVLGLFLLVTLAFVRELLSACAVATFIGLVSLHPAVHNESTIKRRIL